MLLPVLMLVLVVLPCAATESLPCPTPKPTPQAISKQLDEGNAAFEAGDISKAEKQWTEIRKCASGTSDWPKAVFNLGLLEYRRNHLRQAITHFDEILQSHPNDREPGGNIMETNRNYSFRSALAISECYETMGEFSSALRYAWLAKTKYRYFSWCGTCYNSANFAVNKRIAYLVVRVSRLHIWAGMLLLGFVGFRWKKSRSSEDSARITIRR